MLNDYGQHCVRCCSNLLWVGVHSLYFVVLQLVLGLWSLYLQKLLEIVFCRLADTNGTQWHVDVLLLKLVTLRPEYFFLIRFITGLHFVLQNAQPVENFTGSDLVNVEATDSLLFAPPVIIKSLNNAQNRLRCSKVVWLYHIGGNSWRQKKYRADNTPFIQHATHEAYCRKGSL